MLDILGSNVKCGPVKYLSVLGSLLCMWTKKKLSLQYCNQTSLIQLAFNLGISRIYISLNQREPQESRQMHFGSS